MSGGAYRDAGAAVERAEALERELDEMRAEVVRLRAEAARRTTKAPAREPPNIAKLKSDLVDVRAENEVLRSQLRNDELLLRRIADLERRVASQEPPPPKTTITAGVILERDALRTEVVALRKRVHELEQQLAAIPPPPSSEGHVDNRDAVIRRLNEERDELIAELRALGRRR